MGLRIAEINQNAVTHIFGDEPVEAAHDLGDTFLIGGHNFAQVLRIHARGESGRTDEVRKHHRHVAAFGGLGRGGRRRRRRCASSRSSRCLIEFGDRARQLTPMT
jgi:hypothetical protein